MLNTLKVFFPLAELVGCNFHFKHAIKTPVENKGKKNCRSLP